MSDHRPEVRRRPHSSSALPLTAVGLPLVPVQPAGATHTQSGYWMVTKDGQIFAFGGAVKIGEAIAATVDRVDVEATPTGHGYWILGVNGAVHEFGDGPHLDSARDKLPAGERFVSMSASPTGAGYWLFTNRGRVFPSATPSRSETWPPPR